MNPAIQSDVQLALAPVAKPEPAELTLRNLDSAELIHVGGGYCAADY